MSALISSLMLIGCGKMGTAMLQGWLRDGLSPNSLTVLEPHPAAPLLDLCAEKGIALNPAATDLRAPAVMVLAIKPQMLDSAAPMLSALAQPSTMVISILAGKSIADLEGRMPDTKAFVRAMPNTPAAVGRGIAGLYAAQGVSEAQKIQADWLMKSIGRVEWVAAEGLIDAVTAVSGSGPAYVFYLVEALAEAGKKAGLPPEIAMRLARATIEGAGELLFQEHATPASELRQNVTSPSGTTAAALGVLMADDGLAPLMARAVAAAKQRAEELAG